MYSGRKLLTFEDIATQHFPPFVSGLDLIISVERLVSWQSAHFKGALLFQDSLPHTSTLLSYQDHDLESERLP